MKDKFFSKKVLIAISGVFIFVVIVIFYLFFPSIAPINVTVLEQPNHSVSDNDLTRALALFKSNGIEAGSLIISNVRIDNNGSTRISVTRTYKGILIRRRCGSIQYIFDKNGILGDKNFGVPIPDGIFSSDCATPIEINLSVEPEISAYKAANIAKQEAKFLKSTFSFTAMLEIYRDYGEYSKTKNKDTLIWNIKPTTGPGAHIIVDAHTGEVLRMFDGIYQ